MRGDREHRALFVTHGIDEAIRGRDPYPGPDATSRTAGRDVRCPAGNRVRGTAGFGELERRIQESRVFCSGNQTMADVAAPKLVRAPALRRALAGTPWRRFVILAGFALVWELYARWLDNALLLPTLGATLSALWSAILSGELPNRALTSLRVLITGYALGVVVAAVLTALAALSRWGNEALGLLTSMFNPLPAIALLPIALLWFGVGTPSLIFVIVHSVLWPVALACYGGFLAVPPTLRMAGRNLGLSGGRFVAEILVPAAFLADPIGLCGSAGLSPGAR